MVFIGFCAASFVTAIFCLMLIGSMASPSAFGNRCRASAGQSTSTPPQCGRGQPRSIIRSNIRSGNNVSVYMINQDQLVILENGSSFPFLSRLEPRGRLSCLKVWEPDDRSYYLVIVNGLSANSTGPVTVDYQLNIGGQTSQMTIIGWIWSVIALAAMVGVAIGNPYLSKKTTKRTAPKRLQHVKMSSSGVIY